MESLENGNFVGVKFIGKRRVYNGYLNKEQSWKAYQQRAERNIY